MKKFYMLCALVSVVFAQAAAAAPIGWYDLQATWRDGTFDGRLHYDGAAPGRITAVRGTLVDLVQTAAIDRISYLDYDAPAPWAFLSNTNPRDPGGHDAGFYLALVDLGTALTLDLSGPNGLYDWSSDAHYNPAQLDDSPLLSFSLVRAGVVPEPGNVILLLAGLAALGGSARWRCRLRDGQARHARRS